MADELLLDDGMVARSLGGGNTWTDISAHAIFGAAYRGNSLQG